MLGTEDMELKDPEKLIESFKKRPLKTISALIILVLILSAIAFFSSFFSEKGKRAAGLSKEGTKVEQSSKHLSLQPKETEPQPTISQHTEGNQAPIVNVGPGGKSIISYGHKSPPHSPAPEKSSSVTSVGQTGWITAQNVVINVEEKPKPRALTPDQKKAILDFLVNKPKAAFVIKANMTVPDAWAYADQIAEPFRNCGWNVRIDNAIISGPNVSGGKYSVNPVRKKLLQQ
jgi:hypothetical protein